MASVEGTNCVETLHGWFRLAQESGVSDVYRGRRGQVRYRCRLPMEMLVNGETFYVHCRDVSESGLGIVSSRPVDEDVTHVDVRRDESEPWVRCSVAHMTQSVGSVIVGLNWTGGD